MNTMHMSTGAEPLKIAFYTLGSRFNGNTIKEKGLGGSESALLYMARELRRLGNAVSVFCACDRPGNYGGVEYRNADDFIAFCHSAPQDVCIFSRLYEPLAESNCRARVLWLHDVASSKYYTHGLPGLNQHVSRYFVISDWQRRGFLETFDFGPERYYLTRNGVDLSLFEDPPPRNRYKLIYINTPFRGLDVLLGLFPYIQQAVPGVELHLYTGMSLYGDQFREWDEKLRGLYEHAQKMPDVHLREPLPKAELARELMSSGLSLYPSHFEECCSIASLEVQAAGVPMITSDLAGLRDTIIDGQTGVLIPIDNEQHTSYSRQYQVNFLNQTVRLLRDENAWRAMSENARRHIEENYSWARIAMEWQREFANLLSG